ncbi:5-deoxy-glucuronate isomerase [Microbispora rosea]|uniref:5-deoxy-glucuronate isomerase n=1 Tax=Microbispora rosea TaxID=58117 RepID=A0A1N7DCA8_9ACTN|nr:5-deoxy-glucuronate isomerase [Microbispora rosea]
MERREGGTPLNVLAGPADKRSSAFSDDPGHALRRDTWAGRPVDPRLGGVA